MSVHKVLVLGGGPTGLATAYRLAKAGVPVQVIERLPWTGGLCKTFQRGDLSLDLGPHRFTPHTQEVLDLVRDVCGDDLVLVPEITKFFLFNKVISYPFKLGELLRAAPLWTPFHMGLTWVLDSLWAQIRRLTRLQENSYEQWTYARFGRGLTNFALRPLAEKTWGLPLSQLSSRLAKQRIALSSLWEIAWQIITGRRGKAFKSQLYPEGTFYYPKHGYGTITDQMTNRILGWGGEVTTSAEVTKIAIQDGRVKSVGYVQGGKEKVAEGDYVVSTIPIDIFGKVLEDPGKPAALEEVRGAARNLRFRRLILLYLVVGKERVYDANVVFFPDKRFSFGRTWQQKGFSPGMIPEGKSVLGLEIACWEEDEIWHSDDQRVFELVISQLEQVQLLRRSEVRDYFSVRLGYVYPVWNLAYREHLEIVQRYVSGVEDLLLNGRPGYFFYNNIHQSLEMGVVAADHILQGGNKTDWGSVVKKWDEYRLVE